ncbi:TIGR01777 family oxidoreductase [Flavobacterium sp. N2270]|uniref:TIGR01777 family oxidoreductase n=1 Tax=Flavobacterium sp. N2270 TaxID=2986831 RepID=UPI00222496C4|nr:TIGR01777 family oxidoreductase [Flavobacterium sp. N2270]
MKVLITGATGLVGNELIKILLQNGISVNYLTTSRGKIANENNYKGFFWNPSVGEINEEAFTNVDVIVHLAGATVAKRWTNSYKQEIMNSRIDSTKLLYKTLERINHQVSQIVSASAIGIYPDSLTKVYHETDLEVDNSFLGNVVKQWEEEVNQFKNLDILVAKIRIGLVLSKNGGALQEMVKPIKIGTGAAFGSGEHYQSWIHIQDLAAVFYHIIQYKREGIYNGVSPYPVTNSQLTKAIAKTLGKPLFLPNIPKFVMKLILGDMHQLLFSSQHVSSRKLLDENFQFKYASLDKALHDLLK